MKTNDCSVVLVHGIGSQKPNWSSGFQHELQAELGDIRVDIVDAYWAPLSTLNDTAPPLAWPFALPGMDREVETFLRTQFEVSMMLAQDAGLSLNPAAIDPANFWAAIGRNLDVGADLAADIAKYVARNSVRTAVQSVLHAILGQLHEEDKYVILVSHSQGTVIAYDVLRQAGRCYENVRTWITMGSPLRKYFAFPLQWGRDQLRVPEKAALAQPLRRTGHRRQGPEQRARMERAAADRRGRGQRGERDVGPQPLGQPAGCGGCCGRGETRAGRAAQRARYRRPGRAGDDALGDWKSSGTRERWTGAAG